jgi:hypothetical protein
MIQVTSSFETPLMFWATAKGFPVYLDNWAIGDLAEGAPSRRERFVEAVRAGAEILFSIANAVELTGPKGKSLDAVKGFLNELGPHWVPMELNPFKVLEREQNGVSPAESGISDGFVTAYFHSRTADCSPRSGKIIDLSPDFFRLGMVLDWFAKDESLLKHVAQLGDWLKIVHEFRTVYKQNPSLLDWKCRTTSTSQPATFACRNLARTLIIESGQLKKGDAMDFCHAVMGSAFASFATLDKNWKRRVDALPKPNRLARIYDPTQLDQMVTDIELALKQKGANTVSHKA